jgi:Leucine-rich repeat (LRR) protein
LQNFPLLRRVKTLLLSNNLIFRVGEDLKESLPSLHTLMLANNNILNLQDLLPLASLPKLERLVLIENNVTKQPNYRLFVINLLPKLLVLDFNKVKPKVNDTCYSMPADKVKCNVAGARGSEKVLREWGCPEARRSEEGD